MGIFDRTSTPEPRQYATGPEIERPPVQLADVEEFEPIPEIDVAQTLKVLASKIRRTEKKTLAAYLELGDTLSQAQELLATSGAFTKWFRKLGLSKPNVYRSMAAFKHFGECSNLRRFSKASIEILTKCEPAREKAFTLAEQGENITILKARRLVREFVPQTKTKTRRGGQAPTEIVLPGGIVRILHASPGITPATLLSQAMAYLANAEKAA